LRAIKPPKREKHHNEEGKKMLKPNRPVNRGWMGEKIFRAHLGRKGNGKRLTKENNTWWRQKKVDCRKEWQEKRKGVDNKLGCS